MRADARRALIDRDLDEVADCRGRWTEDGPYGGTVALHLDAEHWRRVLAARPAYLARRPKLTRTLPGLRLVRPGKMRRAS